MSNSVCNIASALPEMTARNPQQIAMHCPGTRNNAGMANYDLTLSYAELDQRSAAIAAGLKSIGIVRGIRTVVMVPPGPEFFLLMYALFRVGAIPVMIDPGINKRALRQCLDEAEPEAFIGITLAQIARVVLRWAPRSIRIIVNVGGRWPFGGHSLSAVEALGAADSNRDQIADTQADDVAAILFTSGSTGVPKGVVYRHRHFVAQIDLLREAMNIQSGGVDLPTFPPFALFDPALGLTSVIPDMDPTSPAKADPTKLHHAIEKFSVTQLFGSPALIRVLAAHGKPLKGVKRIASAGAPVPADVVGQMRELMDSDAQLWTPYGATECLPIAIIESRELESTRIQSESGEGTCVGKPLPRNQVRIIAIDDEPIADWHSTKVLGIGEIGEITVAGPSTTDSYFNREQATRLAKINERMADGRERVVHRMGDLGYLDAQGRLWFCGRKTQRVRTAQQMLATERVEPVFNAHPDVFRTALVGLGPIDAQMPVVCVELNPQADRRQWSRIEWELKQLARKFDHTRSIMTFLLHRKFPVDIRHNAKIGRESLALWAAKKLGFTS